MAVAATVPPPPPLDGRSFERSSRPRERRNTVKFHTAFLLCLLRKWPGGDGRPLRVTCYMLGSGHISDRRTVTLRIYDGSQQPASPPAPNFAGLLFRKQLFRCEEYKGAGIGRLHICDMHILLNIRRNHAGKINPRG